MRAETKPQIAFILSLIGGVLILFAGATCCSWFWLGGTSFGGIMGGLGGIMSGYHGMMGSLGVPYSAMNGFSIIGLVSGILVIIGAVMLHIRPAEQVGWGVVILVFSIISFLGMGGFFIGAVLGIIGGTLALNARSAS
jgi:hypothetical protein